MTLASSIITRGFRRANLIVKGASPTSTEQAEGLDFLNGILLSTIGNEAGGELCDLMIGGEFDESDRASDWIPENARLVCNLDASETLNLHPAPYEGQRIAIVDAGGNFSTANLTLDGNGRNIEAASTLTLSTNSMNRQWLYRADTANWVKIAELATSDTMPLPTEFDQYFVDSLAIMLSPAFSASLPQEILMGLQRTKGLIQARYRKPRRQNEPMLGLLHQRRRDSDSAFGFGRVV